MVNLGLSSIQGMAGYRNELRRRLAGCTQVAECTVFPNGVRINVSLIQERADDGT
jgi:hypothetical protein